MATELECSQFWDNKLKQEGIFNTKNDVQNAKLEYQKKCGMYDKDVLDCIKLETTMQSQISTYANQSTMYYLNAPQEAPTMIANTKKQFADKGCVQKLEKLRQSELGKVIDEFSSLDKARIQSESINERNQRIFFGGLVLIVGIALITMFSKSK